MGTKARIASCKVEEQVWFFSWHFFLKS